jgi:hypothetical protein
MGYIWDVYQLSDDQRRRNSELKRSSIGVLKQLGKKEIYYVQENVSRRLPALNNYTYGNSVSKITAVLRHGLNILVEVKFPTFPMFSKPFNTSELVQKYRFYIF